MGESVALFVFDRDDDLASNYVPPAQFANDFFKGTDYWIEARYDPTNGWSLVATDAAKYNFTPVQTGARLIIEGSAMILIIPRDEFATDVPGFRLTAFRHTGAFGYDGDWDADVQPPVDQPLLTLPISSN